jgi:isoaspartyl peptidase/L-asparaginase-like protein (Ntn-hydrolase superfamily)
VTPLVVLLLPLWGTEIAILHAVLVAIDVAITTTKVSTSAEGETNFLLKSGNKKNNDFKRYKIHENSNSEREDEENYFDKYTEHIVDLISSAE